MWSSTAQPVSDPDVKNIFVSFSPPRSVVRLAASLLTKLVDSLAPSITSVLVHGKQVSEHTERRAPVVHHPFCTNDLGLFWVKGMPGQWF